MAPPQGRVRALIAACMGGTGLAYHGQTTDYAESTSIGIQRSLALREAL